MNPAEAADRALTAVPGMSGARVVAMLSDGPTNSSYRVGRGDESFVLRLDKPQTFELGLDRENEKLVCGHVAAAGLAPEPLFFDPAAGIFLRRFLPGRSWRPADLETPENLVRLARLLHRLHGLPPAGRDFDPLAAVLRYAAQLETPEARAIGGRAEGLLAEIDRFPAKRCICHNDLVCQNVLQSDPPESGSLSLIDWEYAAVGDPWFDLAVVVEHHGLKRSLVPGFLTAYLGRPASDGEMERLSLQRGLYACLLKLWRMRT